MIASQKIDFRQSRDIGQVYNTAFRFLRQNRSVLFKSVTYYIMPFIFVAGFLIFSGLSDFITIAVKGVDGNWLALGLGFLQGFLGLLMSYVAYTAYITLVYEYMRLYHEAEDPSKITHKDVWRATRKRFWIGLANVLVWGIAASLFTGAVAVILYMFFAFLMLIGVLISAAANSVWIMGIFYVLFYITYFLVIFYIQSLTFPMVFLSAFERIDIFTAFGRSFSMVNRKGSIWNAIGSSFLGASMMRILHSNMVSLPVATIAGIIAYNGVEMFDSFDTNNIWFILLFRVILPVCNVIYFYTLTIYFVTQAFEALNLNERYLGKGMLEKIEKIGTRKDVGPEYYDLTY